MATLRTAAPGDALAVGSHGSGGDRPPLVSVRDAHERLTPEFLAVVSQRLRDCGAPGAIAGGTRPDRAARWLTAAMLALAALAAAAAVVSFSAQYRMVLTAKSNISVAALEAAIPDVAALIFATLGVALALHGRRAIRARVLNVSAVGTSVAMNVLAAGHGWRDLAIWAMPPVAYALASDTAIGVVRARTLARARSLNDALAEDEATPLALVGSLLLWLLRLTLAPASTLAGFRAWVVEECPVAPGRRANPAAPASRPQVTGGPTARAITSGPARRRRRAGTRPGTKTARFLALVIERHGPLDAFPLPDVSRVSAELAPQVGLNPGAARSALRRHVLAARNESPS
jgi:hypothetical protein